MEKSREEKTSTQANTRSGGSSGQAHPPGAGVEKGPFVPSREVSRGGSAFASLLTLGSASLLRAPDWAQPAFCLSPPPSQCNSPADGEGLLPTLALPKHQGSHMWGRAGLLRRPLMTLMPDISILSRLFNCGVWGTDSAHSWTPTEG